MHRQVSNSVRAAVALLLLSTPAFANTLYVSPSGNDASSGTLTAPLATPQRALALAAPGDSILLRGGAYTITRSLQIILPGLTVSSYPGESARIVGNTTDVVDLTSVIVIYAARVTLDRLELEGGSYYGVKVDDHFGPVQGVTLRGLYVHHTGRDGLKIQQADGIVIEDCEIGFTGMRDASNAEGIDMMATVGATVRRNRIHDTATNGIFVKAGSRQAMVDSNVIERTGYSGILLGSESDAVFMRDGAQHEAIDSTARNNLVIDTGYAGLGSIAGSNIRFEHNTVVRAARLGQATFRAAPNQYGTPSRGIVLLNNVFWLAPTSVRPMVHLYHYEGALISDGNIWFSPGGRYQFWRESADGAASYWTDLAQWRSAMSSDGSSQAVDPRLDAAASYRPLDDSPAIDRGVTSLLVALDIAGVTRPQGLGPDVGASERPSTTRPSPPTGLRIVK